MKQALGAARSRGSKACFIFFSELLVLALSTSSEEASSMGSPRGVPVPWRASDATKKEEEEEEEEETEEEDERVLSASFRARRIRAACAGPCGAVSPAARPLWLTAIPAMSARGRSLSAKEDEDDEEEEDKDGEIAASARTTTPSPRP
jgi:ribosomal protein L12E/L44/L45/RPP1/RPP2